MKLPARELNGTHLGKTATLTTGSGTTISGPIIGIEHEAGIVDDTTFADAGVTRWVLGRIIVSVTIMDSQSVQLAPHAQIEVAE